MKWQTLILVASVTLGCCTAALAQQSVEVPQILQKDVHAFKLTIDSLNALTRDLHSTARAAFE